MAKQKFYVVIVGKDVGVFATWLETAALVLNVPGSIHQSFPTLAQAEALFEQELFKGNVRIVDGVTTSASNATAPRARATNLLGPPDTTSPRSGFVIGSSFSSPSVSVSSSQNTPQVLSRSSSELAHSRRTMPQVEYEPFQSQRGGSPVTVQTPSEISSYPSPRGLPTTSHSRVHTPQRAPSRTIIPFASPVTSSSSRHVPQPVARRATSPGYTYASYPDKPSPERPVEAERGRLASPPYSPQRRTTQNSARTPNRPSYIGSSFSSVSPLADLAKGSLRGSPVSKAVFSPPPHAGRFDTSASTESASSSDSPRSSRSYPRRLEESSALFRQASPEYKLLSPLTSPQLAHNRLAFNDESGSETSSSSPSSSSGLDIVAEASASKALHEIFEEVAISTQEEDTVPFPGHFAIDQTSVGPLSPMHMPNVGKEPVFDPRSPFAKGRSALVPAK